MATLLAASEPGGTVSLDSIGDAVGAAAVTYDDLERLIEGLEVAGRIVAAPAVELRSDLTRVLRAAHRLQERFGRTPRLAELAAETGLSTANIVTALRFARTLG